MRYLVFGSCLFLSSLVCAHESDAKGFHQFESVQKLAEIYQKPILIGFFGGSPAAESETLLVKVQDKQFIKAVSSHFYIHCADLNLPLFQEEELVVYNQLIQKFGIKSFPTLVLCDSQLNEISRFGECDLDALQLAQKIIQTNFDHDLIAQKLVSASSESLLAWFKRALDLGAYDLQNKILDKAFTFDQIDTELKIEKYLKIVRDSKDEKLILAFKEQYLVAEFESNPYLLERIALIDFQFNLPLHQFEKVALEKGAFNGHLVQVPN